MTNYVLLMRHGRHEAADRSNPEQRKLSCKGEQETRAVAERKPQQRPAWLVWRPPSSAVWVLYQNMMRIWRYLFTAATYAVLLGLFFLAVAVFKLKDPLIILLIPAIGLAVFWYYYRTFGPELGSED